MVIRWFHSTSSNHSWSSSGLVWTRKPPFSAMLSAMLVYGSQAQAGPVEMGIADGGHAAVGGSQPQISRESSGYCSRWADGYVFQMLLDKVLHERTSTLLEIVAAVSSEI